MAKKSITYSIRHVVRQNRFKQLFNTVRSPFNHIVRNGLASVYNVNHSPLSHLKVFVSAGHLDMIDFFPS